MRETPDDLVELRTVVNELEAGMIEGVLAEAGIPASHRTAKGIYLAMGMSSLHPSTVLVRRADVERAEEVLSANRKDSVDIDWDEVDVGEVEDRVAAKGAAALQLSRMRKGAVRGAGLAVVFLILIAPAVGGAAAMLAWLTPWRAYAGPIGWAVGLGVAVWLAVKSVPARRAKRHDADVFGMGDEMKG